MTASPARIRSALRHLQRADPVMRDLIQHVGPCRLKLQRNRFRSLARAIVSQQISAKAAQAIFQRLERCVGPGPLNPVKVARVPPGELQRAGLSVRKVEYLQDLAARILDGRVRLRNVARMTEDEIVAELVQVKGIGLWTAQMFLIFSLGRMDVFPHEDLGIRKALRQLYGLTVLPDRETSERIARPWRPYASVASWYCWRSFDRTPAEDRPETS